MKRKMVIDVAKWIRQKLLIYIRHVMLFIRVKVVCLFYGMDIHPTCRISLKANLDKTNPRGVHIGEYSYVAFGAVILTHDFINNVHVDTFIGKKCFVGCNSIILPGIRVGDNVVVAAGSVVSQNIPNNSLVAGNPAKIIRKIETKEYGQFK